MHTDILLIGAGPIGIEVAAALKLSGLNYHHIEAGCLASTISWWSPGTQIFSSADRIAIADIPFSVYPNIKASREEYLNYLRSVVLKYQLHIEFGKRVIRLKNTEQGFAAGICASSHGVGGPAEYLQSSGAESSAITDLIARKVVLAIGDMHLPKELGIEGEKQPNVSHFLEEVHKYFGLRVAIIGAKNSAAEAVVRLGRLGCQIVWCVRGDHYDSGKIKPWLLPDLNALIKEKRVEVRYGVEVQKIRGNLMTVRSAHGEQPEFTEIRADQFLLLTGYRQNPQLFEQLGLELIGDSKRPKFNSATMECSVPGVFVAGTGTAGTQLGGARVFIENCHNHSVKIARALGSKAQLFECHEDRAEADREQ